MRYSLLAANVVLLFAVILFVAHTPSTNTTAKKSALVAQSATTANPLDALSSADIAVHAAQLVRMEEIGSVMSTADSVNAQLAITPADNKIVAKPQVVATSLKSRRDIRDHTVQAGETVSSIAAKYGITSDSIRWSNNLRGDTVTAGTNLTISPVTGIVYTVKQGDTPESLATRFRVSKEQIISFNDAEVTGLPVGEKIVIPNGIMSFTSTTGTVASSGFAWGGYSAIYGYNGYDYGYCTWWSAKRRADIGRPIPSNLGHARTWKNLAQVAGFSVNNTPAPGAVIWSPPRDFYGHVAFVESVNPDGSVYISEMNTVGWNRVSYKTLTAEQAAIYSFIH